MVNGTSYRENPGNGMKISLIGKKESAGGKLKFYNINYKVSNLNGCLES